MGKPSRINLRLALEHPDRESDGMGGYRITWRRLGFLWAAIQAASGREQQGEVGAKSVVTWRMTVRGAPDGDPRRPRPGQRFRLDRRLFLIEAVGESDPAGRWLTCYAREEDPA